VVLFDLAQLSAHAYYYCCCTPTVQAVLFVCCCRDKEYPQEALVLAGISTVVVCLLSVFAKMLDDCFPASVLGILGAMAKMTLVGALLHKLGR
jgi:hypothetical protein